MRRYLSHSFPIIFHEQDFFYFQSLLHIFRIYLIILVLILHLYHLDLYIS